MVFTLPKNEFMALLKYLAFADKLANFKTTFTANENECTIYVEDDELDNFISVTQYLSVMFGMDAEQNNLTDIGITLITAYDRIVYAYDISREAL